MEAPIYNAQGKKSGTVTLSESVFDVKWNNALMHQVVHSMLDNARTPTAHVKDRGEVRGGGKKPWRQKGTGRARHGSIRSPIWKGGGVTHGPRKDKDYSRAIPKKMRAKALFMALSKKLRDGEIIFIENFGLTEPKTSVAKKTLTALSGISGFEKLSTKKKNAALIAFPEMNDAARKSFSNLGNVRTVKVSDLNPVVVLGNSFVVIESPEASTKIIEGRMAKKSPKGDPSKAENK